MDLESEFRLACEFSTSQNSASDQQKLALYALFKQATVGPCTDAKPGWFDFVGQAKQSAWSQLGQMSKSDAMRGYLDTVMNTWPQWKSHKSIQLSSKNVDNEDGIEYDASDNEFVSSNPSAMGMKISTVKPSYEDLVDVNSVDPFDCIQRGDFERIRRALKSGFDVNSANDEGLTLLHWSADLGYLDFIKELLEVYKASVDVRDESGQTPLHYACLCERLDVCRFLISAGAKLVQCPDDDGQSPIDLVESEEFKSQLKTS